MGRKPRKSIVPPNILRKAHDEDFLNFEEFEVETTLKSNDTTYIPPDTDKENFPTEESGNRRRLRNTKARREVKQQTDSVTMRGRRRKEAILDDEVNRDEDNGPVESSLPLEDGVDGSKEDKDASNNDKTPLVDKVQQPDPSTLDTDNSLVETEQIEDKEEGSCTQNNLELGLEEKTDKESKGNEEKDTEETGKKKAAEEARDDEEAVIDLKDGDELSKDNNIQPSGRVIVRYNGKRCKRNRVFIVTDLHPTLKVSPPKKSCMKADTSEASQNSKTFSWADSKDNQPLCEQKEFEEDGFSHNFRKTTKRQVLYNDNI
ncbi:unnamed protein product [Bursaphelenchus okinawaensis]|uniref:Uncharacterized protein n=1 Tax=Bursaphelenchus okinawaensis TaxID=465554 RepID=A0A811LR44_9BILA|nr:unnamed protein product [Bursaphelenchus okinawaensis]CAG9126891.1 unnamed protein product [Bursaphelenchus okinawaensis]